MEWNIESLLFYILLLDAFIAVVMAYTGKQQWWTAHVGKLAQHFPLSRGWTALYFLLVLFIGHILGRYNLLVTLW